MTVRRAQPEDAAIAAEIFLTARRVCLSYLPKVHADEETRVWIAETMFRRCEVWVAETADAVLGFMALHEDMLEHLFVLPENHRKGIGTMLLNKVKQVRPDGFRLWVFQQNAQARQFYEKHGLRCIQLTDGAANEERTPDAMYEWTGEGTALVRAVATLRAGGVVAFPTETVYGLGADATNASAVAWVFQIKGRPATNPLICHVADESVARRYAREWPEIASKLAATLWPGPLTLVVPKSPVIVDAVTAGRDTVALRVPDHPLALELLRAFDGPLAGPSANKSSHVSPTAAQHVRDELGDEVEMVLDGGPCRVGIESTVLDLSSGVPTILRPGDVTRAQIEELIGAVRATEVVADLTTPAKSPGQHEKHYAPRTPAFRFEPYQRSRVDLTDAAIVEITLDPSTYARNFYARLRLLDKQKLRAIYIEMPPDKPEWRAIRDRVRRATRPIA